MALPSSGAAPESALAAPDPAALIASLAQSPPARTRFTEVRFSGLLDRPLILSGELEYLGPGQLAKHVASPWQETIRVEAGEAVIQRGDKPPRRVALAQVPELEGFLRGFSALLGGDAPALARDFELAVQGSAANWQLHLKPRDARLARRISAIEVDGRGSTARCFQTRDADDDLGILLVADLATIDLPTRPSSRRLQALCRGLVAP